MRWDEIHETPCSIARALSVVGDRWTGLIVRDAFLGIRRFDELQRSLGMSRHRLADRLERLVAEGVLLGEKIHKDAPRFEYRLTEKGRDLYPVILLLKQWGDRWMVGPEGPPALHRHRNCGHITTAVLTCSECKETLSPFDMQVEPGPGLASSPPESSAPSA